MLRSLFDVDSIQIKICSLYFYYGITIFKIQKYRDLKKLITQN
uniref:Uncharacterized protein n=1 Tax=Anguilla anguilla TaxID=7936 RepID=A0A0E9THE4_ANGAN